MKRAGIILAMVAMLALAGCKAYSVECELVLQPRVMLSSGSGDRTPAYMARLYVYYIDEKDARETNWRPESFADADAGIVRRRSTGEVRSYNLMGEQYHGEDSVDDYIHIILTKSPVLLVAVDPVNRFYAYRVFRYEIPFPKVYVPVYFKTYLPRPEKDGEWTIAGERHESVQEEESEE